MFSTGRRSAPLVCLLLAGSAAGAWAAIGATEALRSPSTPAYDDLLVALAGWLLVACAWWWVLVCAATAVETLSSGRLRATAWVGCPPALRRLLLAGVGVALAGAPASASTDSTQQALPVPARPLGSVLAAEPARLLVHPGDTLWQLATHELAATASAEEVAVQVRRLHHRNRGVIGPDPDLIRPGQRLVVPRVPRHLLPDHARHRHPEEDS